MVPEPGIHFNKRSENPDAHRDECGVSVAREHDRQLGGAPEALERLGEAPEGGEKEVEDLTQRRAISLR